MAANIPFSFYISIKAAGKTPAQKGCERTMKRKKGLALWLCAVIFLTGLGGMTVSAVSEEELTAKSAKLGATVPSGRVLVDGMGVGDVGTVVLRDRKLLADEGMVVVVMTLSAENAQLISGPDIISRGFVYEKENDKLIDELRRVAMESVSYCEDNGITDWASIKSRVKSGLSGYLFKKTRRSPMILPIIMEV